VSDFKDLPQRRGRSIRWRRCRRAALTVCLFFTGLGYAPVLLYLDLPVPVVVATAPPVIVMVRQMIRRIRSGRPSGIA